MKIHIVDHDTNRLRSIRSILSSIGYRAGDVQTDLDTEAGMENMKRRRPDIAMVANNVPKTGGLQLLADIRENSNLSDIHVIMYGCDPSKEDVLEAIQSGANGYLVHPCSVGDVEDILRKYKNASKA